MSVSNYADKIVGVLGLATLSARAVVNGTSLEVAEPSAGSVVRGSALMAQFSANNNEICAKAIDKVRKQTEKDITKALGDNREHAQDIAQAFEDFDHHIADVRPSISNLVKLWQLEPQAIASGLMARLDGNTKTIKSNLKGGQELARQVVARVIMDAAAAFKGEAAFSSGVERAYASQPRTAGDETVLLALANNAMLRQLLETKNGAGSQRGAIDQQAIIALAQRICPQVNDYDHALQELEQAVLMADELQRQKGKALQRLEFTALEADWQQSLRDGNAKAAAQKIAQFALSREVDASKHFAALRTVQDEWYVRGHQHGNNLDLAVAVELAHFSVARAQGASQRGAALNDLGTALSILGERTADDAHLAAAVAAFGDALKEYTRKRTPLDWAMTQNNLGTALLVQAERSPGIAALEGAVAAFKETIKEYTRERAPLDWGMAQNNLGLALSSLGQRCAGIGYLDAAVTAFDEALKEITRAQSPLDWAMIKNYQGLALSTIGERSSGTSELQAAVIAFEEALTEMKRPQAPLAWSAIQNSLGLALSRLGERSGNASQLEAAVGAFEEALLERTRARFPMSWALTQNSLGLVLHKLGQLQSNAAHLKAAVRAFEQALIERTPAQWAQEWAATQNNLGAALLALGQLDGDATQCEAAVSAYNEALKVHTRQSMPLDWAAAQSNLGAALLALGQRASDIGKLEAAQAAFGQALKEFTRERLPLDWAATQNQIGIVQLELGQRRSNLAHLQAAVKAFEQALMERTYDRGPQVRAESQDNLRTAQDALALYMAGQSQRETDAAMPHAGGTEPTLAHDVRVQRSQNTPMGLTNGSDMGGQTVAQTAQSPSVDDDSSAALNMAGQIQVPVERQATGAQTFAHGGNGQPHENVAQENPVQENVATSTLERAALAQSELEAAVRALTQVLKERTREIIVQDQTINHEPMSVAQVAATQVSAIPAPAGQHNLYHALATTPIRVKTAVTAPAQPVDGLRSLDAAVAIYSEAMKQRRPESGPVSAAATSFYESLVYEALFDESGAPEQAHHALTKMDAAYAMFADSNAAFYCDVVEKARTRVLAKLHG